MRMMRAWHVTADGGVGGGSVGAGALLPESGRRSFRELLLLQLCNPHRCGAPQSVGKRRAASAHPGATLISIEIRGCTAATAWSQRR